MSSVNQLLPEWQRTINASLSLFEEEILPMNPPKQLYEYRVYDLRRSLQIILAFEISKGSERLIESIKHDILREMSKYYRRAIGEGVFSGSNIYNAKIFIENLLEFVSGTELLWEKANVFNCKFLPISNAIKSSNIEVLNEADKILKLVQISYAKDEKFGIISDFSIDFGVSVSTIESIDEPQIQLSKGSRGTKRHRESLEEKDVPDKDSNGKTSAKSSRQSSSNGTRSSIRNL